ncbi:polysaccharide biosynthesis/export family protein [Oryzibacter oryziterrae]|uniref:polysaccharide biosynthesis/export family protein n=1 Tax=Oryzibacter oryziterrae TaxID=2766474 RepID=UPI001F282282|nr:polysaccharide biosynthesis/export family protein [Oryzibacter oryziterrae]
MVSGAKATVTQSGKQSGLDYALVDLSKDVLPYFEFEPQYPLSSFGAVRGGPTALPLGVGDLVSVTIFESQSGGLFIPSDAGSRAGNFISIPSQTVDSSGNISIPYAGQIHVAGRTPIAAQHEIESRLANRAIEPQAIISLETSRSSEVSVLGDVHAPKKFSVSPNGDRVLDAIAQGGGLSEPAVETYVTLQRHGRKATVLFDTLVNNPSENIYLLPGDTVYVNRERRTYLAFGATGESNRFDFEEADLTFGEALAKAGGLNDNRADPSQVFLFRTESRDLLAKIGVDVSRFQGTQIPVVFRANLRDPSAFFVTQKFPMKDKDILYISNAASVELTKILDLVNSASSTYEKVK